MAETMVQKNPETPVVEISKEDIVLVKLNELIAIQKAAHPPYKVQLIRTFVNGVVYSLGYLVGFVLIFGIAAYFVAQQIMPYMGTFLNNQRPTSPLEQLQKLYNPQNTYDPQNQKNGDSFSDLQNLFR